MVVANLVGGADTGFESRPQRSDPGCWPTARPSALPRACQARNGRPHLRRGPQTAPGIALPMNAEELRQTAGVLPGPRHQRKSTAAQVAQSQVRTVPSGAGLLACAAEATTQTQSTAGIPAPPVSLPPLAPAGESLFQILEDIGDCRRCRLHEGRNKIVFGVGNEKASAGFRGRRTRRR